MGFFQRLFENVFREESSAPAGSFEDLNTEELEAHLAVARYGDFVMTGAVRPAFNLQVIPREGYRHEVYFDEQSRKDVPVLMASASRERLFDLFLEMLDPLGDELDVVLETSHNRPGQGHVDLYREHIDLSVLKSMLCDYEDLLLNDGCTGIAVLNPNLPLELQFDEHKLLIVYGNDLTPFEEILKRADLSCDERLKFVTEAEHIHSSSEFFAEQFEELKLRLGMDGHDDAAFC